MLKELHIQDVPYLGYVEMKVTFLKEFLGADFDVATLVLVVPNIRPNVQSPVLTGINTMEPLYSQCMESEVAGFQPAAHGYRAILKLLQVRHQQQQAGSDGVVRLASKSPVLIPDGQTTVVNGPIHACISAPVQWALVEHPTSPLPGGLCDQNSLIMLPSQSHMKIPVILNNASDQAITIPPQCHC
ncbi:Retrovirus-related Pol polyprotein from transposon 412 [Xyrichtys novacula]|uniref:Retrovirus-related Pol polyprotein from transposon 412 n=1 Tax=Xyrichtys novacula TaxID=13765 RepID=A0AAV1FG46_XYRNO|nr:Retrovirus-related Pol polyprotein from transposon 412 [Xyrichtys novacula]